MLSERSQAQKSAVLFHLNELKKHRQNESMVSEVRKLLVLRSGLTGKEHNGHCLSNGNVLCLVLGKYYMGK